MALIKKYQYSYEKKKKSLQTSWLKKENYGYCIQNYL